MQRNTGYFPTESLEPSGNRLFSRSALNEGDLFREKGRLQTAGLICAPERRLALAQRLMCCGLVRITRAGDMSESLCGEAHDGEYPLRRYVRIVEVEP